MALVLIGSVLGIGFLLLVAVVSLFTGARSRAWASAGVAAAWVALYVALLVGTSLASHEEVLSPGDTKYFCGFFLDCHIGVAVVGHETPATIAGLRTSGVYHVLTLRFSSSARRASLSPYSVYMTLQGDDGRPYGRSRSGEDDLARARSHRREGAPPLERRIEPGGSYTVDVVFELPSGVNPTRLLVSEGYGVDERRGARSKAWPRARYQPPITSRASRTPRPSPRRTESRRSAATSGSSMAGRTRCSPAPSRGSTS